MDREIYRGADGSAPLKSVSEFEHLYIHRRPVDMRKSINGLAAIVQTEMKLDLRSSSLFIFSNKPRTHLKMLYFDRSGFALWLKRLEESRFPWPTNEVDDTISVSLTDLGHLLSGINVFTRFREVHFEEVV